MGIENQLRLKKFNQNFILTCNISTPSIDMSKPSEIHIALSNPNIDVRILAQDYFVSMVSLSLL